MEYNQLTSMFQDGLEPFLDFNDAKGEISDIFNYLDQSANDIFLQPSLGREDDAFPDWLDLKMDFSILEGLETTPTALDDLLQQSEVGYDSVTTGQDPDVLLPLEMENKTLPPSELEQLPYKESPSVKQNAYSVSSPELNVMSPSQTPPPSSPEWIVPEMGDPSSPLSLLSPVPDIANHAYSFTSSSVPSSPAEMEGTVITFVAPIVQPIPLVDTAEVIVEAQTVPLDNILSFSMLLGGVQVNEVEQVTESSSPPPSPVEYVEKPKRKIKTANCKRKALKSKTLRGMDSLEFSVPAPVEKKERKRKQNKDAAMRYRLKKRMETDTMADEENELAEVNMKLKEKAQQLSNELGYLKNLLREMFKARGLLK